MSDTLQEQISARVCRLCDLKFPSQADILAHFAKEHPTVSNEQRGPLTVVRTLGKPWRRERTPRISTTVLYKGEKVEAAGWQPEHFVRGVEWAIENLGVQP